MGNQVVEGPQLGSRTRRAGLQPRQVDEVLHQALEPCGLLRDRRQQLVTIPERQVEPAGEPVRRRADRSDRGAEVVADRTEDSGLHRIASP